MWLQGMQKPSSSLSPVNGSGWDLGQVTPTRAVLFPQQSMGRMVPVSQQVAVEVESVT